MSGVLTEIGERWAVFADCCLLMYFQPDKQLPHVSVANRGVCFKPAWVLVLQNVLQGLVG